MFMSCENVHKLISSLLDRRVSAGERERALAHVKSCRDCSLYYESMGSLRDGLRRLPQPAMPPDLTAKLRVIASHEQHRRVARSTFRGRLRGWAASIELASDHLMRPVALPLAGGVLSALLLFGALVPNLSFAHHSLSDQSFFIDPVGQVVEQVGGTLVKPAGNVPRILASMSGEIPSDANVVDLMVDENGRVCDYQVVHGKLTPDVQSIIMFGQFIPATNLGMPVAAKVRLVQGVGVGGGRATPSVRS